MSQIALIVRHQAKPGMRDALCSVWEHYIKPNASANPGHLACFFCLDSGNDTGVTAFQIFSSEEAKEQFLQSPWYPEYLQKVSEFVAGPPTITSSWIAWSKPQPAAGQA